MKTVVYNGAVLCYLSSVGFSIDETCHKNWGGGGLHFQGQLDTSGSRHLLVQSELKGKVGNGTLRTTAQIS